MTRNFENLVEGAVYRLKGRKYYAIYSRRDQGVWELRTVTTDHLSYWVLKSGEIVARYPKTQLSGMTLDDLELVREPASRTARPGNELERPPTHEGKHYVSVQV